MSGDTSNSQYGNPADAVDLIDDGDTVALGGYYFNRHPMAIVREIIRSGLEDLHVVSVLPTIDVDMLVAAGCVRKVSYSFISFEFLGLAPNFREAVEAGDVEADERSTGATLRGFEAARRKVPSVPTRALAGSEIIETTDVEEIEDDQGNTIVSVPPLKPDVAIVQAQWADSRGHAQLTGSAMDDEMIKAADQVVISAETILSYPEFSRVGKHVLQRYDIDKIIQADYGAHPCSCHPFYIPDYRHVIEYTKATRAGDVDDYLDTYVYGTENNEEYLELLGVDRVTKLANMAEAGVRFVDGGADEIKAGDIA